MSLQTIELTDTERAVIGAFIKGLTVVQIADEHGLPPSAVRGLLYRCCKFQPVKAKGILAAATPKSEPELEPLDLPGIGITDLIAAGPTGRQIHYWTQRGYLLPLNPNPGIGTAMRWPESEASVAALMKRLTDAGLTLAQAHVVARDRNHEVAPGVRVVVDAEPQMLPCGHRCGYPGCDGTWANVPEGGEHG